MSFKSYPFGTTTAAMLLLATPLILAAQTYSIDWHTIDGGGGTSTGGVYSVSGTLGQPDAGTLTGGNYTLQGGFWGGVATAVQTPGAPLLSIARSGTNAFVVSWPLPADGWVLQRTNSIPTLSTAWPQVLGPYQTNATTLSVTFTNSAGNQFFRLHKP